MKKKKIKMLTEEIVFIAASQTAEEAMRRRLEIDARAKVEQAGSSWKDRLLSFYYGTSQASAIMVRTAITRATEDVLGGRFLPGHVWENLITDITSATKTKDAISTIDQALESAKNP